MYTLRLILSGLIFMQGKHFYDLKGDMCIKILYTTMWKTSNAVKTAWIWCIALKTKTVFPFTKLNLKGKNSYQVYLSCRRYRVFLSWLYKCCDTLYAWTTKETRLVIICWLLTRSWIPMQKAQCYQCYPYAHPSVLRPVKFQ